MAIQTGTGLGTEICKALGLDPDGVRKITVVCETNDVAKVTIERYVKDGERIAGLLANYELHEKVEKAEGSGS